MMFPFFWDRESAILAGLRNHKLPFLYQHAIHCEIKLDPTWCHFAKGRQKKINLENVTKGPLASEIWDSKTKSI